MMNRDVVLNVLRADKPVLSQRFGVRELALFGSFARDQATDTSMEAVFDEMVKSKGYETMSRSKRIPKTAETLSRKSGVTREKTNEDDH